MMNVSSSKTSHQGVDKIVRQKPQWLDSFLQKTFFGCCSIHEARKNELSKYCINCNTAVCQYCISSGCHRHHKLLKIYRHVYKDVVPILDMGKHIDCSKIQPYKSNKHLVIALNPLPHCGPLSNEASCGICQRRLNDPNNYRYCSIACKLMAFSRKLVDSEPPYLHPKKRAENQLRRRKGVPQRAPFF